MQRTHALPVQPSPLTVAATFAAVLSPAGLGALHHLAVALAPQRTQPTPAQMTAAAAEREVYAARADQAAAECDFRAAFPSLPQHERDLAVACAATARRNAANYRDEAAKLRAGTDPWGC